MTKYSIARIVCGMAILFIMKSIGFSVTTWQYWTIYMLAWAMVFITDMEHGND